MQFVCTLFPGMQYYKTAPLSVLEEDLVKRVRSIYKGVRVNSKEWQVKSSKNWHCLKLLFAVWFMFYQWNEHV